MNKDCIIYLGGSIIQSSILKYFNKKKIKIILIDQDPSCYCKKFCDHFLNISQKDIPKILFNLNKIIKKKKYKIIDALGIAHYSYEAVNAIKKKYIYDYREDNFLMYKHIQKKKLIKSKLTPKYLNLPQKKVLINKKNYYMNKIFKFYKNSNHKIFIKPSNSNQGIGIIKINRKMGKNKFIDTYFDLIIKNFNFSENLYLEQAVNGKLINLDFIKKENNKIIFFPLIYRDKIKFTDKKKYLTLFEYLNYKNSFDENFILNLKKILKKEIINEKAFGTIDLIQDKNKINILEISPHFHHAKIFKFLNNIDLMDLYFEKREVVYKDKKNFHNNFGGNIVLNTDNKFTKKLINLVKKNSIKTMINSIQTKNRKNYIQKNFSINKTLRVLYFKCKSLDKINLIYLYLRKHKKKIFN